MHGRTRLPGAAGPVMQGCNAPRGGEPSAVHLRAFRTTIFLAVLSLFNAFDVAFTRAQLARGSFDEANFLAAQAIALPGGPVAYKTGLFGIGAVILYRLRHRRVAEFATYGLTAVYAGLMVWWVEYVRCVDVCVSETCLGLPPPPF